MFSRQHFDINQDLVKFCSIHYQDNYIVSVTAYSDVYAPLVHYSDVMMSAMGSQITGVSIVCSTVCSGAYQRTHQSSASLAFYEGNPPDSPHKGPVTRKMFLFDNVIMQRFGNCVKHSTCIIVSRPYPQTMTMDYNPFLFNLSWKSGIKREFQFKYENKVTRYLTQQNIKLRALFEIQSRMSVSLTRLIKKR